jgi:hypothetical protein
MNMGDAMMNRPIVARREAVLRQRQRNSTRKQGGNKRETFQDVHDHPPKTRVHLRSPVALEHRCETPFTTVWLAVPS